MSDAMIDWVSPDDPPRPPDQLPPDSCAVMQEGSPDGSVGFSYRVVGGPHTGHLIDDWPSHGQRDDLGFRRLSGGTRKREAGVTFVAYIWIVPAAFVLADVLRLAGCRREAMVLSPNGVTVAVRFPYVANSWAMDRAAKRAEDTLRRPVSEDEIIAFGGGEPELSDVYQAPVDAIRNIRKVSGSGTTICNVYGRTAVVDHIWETPQKCTASIEWSASLRC